MRRYPRAILSAIVFLGFAGPTLAQNLSVSEPPKLYKPKQPPTRREVELRDSLYRYVDGLAYMREEKFHDALHAFEEAARLDPDAPALVKAQLPILIAMDRFSDALKACKKVIELDPADYSTWYVQAKLNRTLVRYPDAIASLESGLKSAALKDHPEAAQQMYLELGNLYEHTEKFGPAADAYIKAAAILEHPDRIAEKAHVPIEAVMARAADTYEKIGQLYRKAKQHEQSIAAFTKAQERAPDRAGRVSYSLAQVSEEAGQLRQALTHLDAYLRTQPLGVEPYEMKVNLLRRLKEAQAIVPWLEQAAGRDRFNNALQLLYARELVAAKESKKAEAIYTKLVDESPSPEAYRGLFHLYKDQGPTGMNRVLGMLDKVMEKAASDDLAAISRARGMVGALREDGELARLLVDAGSAKPAELQFDTVYFLAVMADKHRKTEEAERLYRQCLRDKKGQANEAVLYSGLLRVLLKGRKYDAAVEVCQDGLKNAKTTSQALFYSDLARAQAGLKRYDDALKTTRTVTSRPIFSRPPTPASRPEATPRSGSRCCGFAFSRWPNASTTPRPSASHSSRRTTRSPRSSSCAISCPTYTRAPRGTPTPRRSYS